MSYVDAGYVIVLVVLSLYAVSLLARRRRLERAAARGARALDATVQESGEQGVTAGHHDFGVADRPARDPLE